MKHLRRLVGGLTGAIVLLSVGALFGCGPKDEGSVLPPEEAKGTHKPTQQGADAQVQPPQTD